MYYLRILEDVSILSLVLSIPWLRRVAAVDRVEELEKVNGVEGICILVKRLLVLLKERSNADHSAEEVRKS